MKRLQEIFHEDVCLFSILLEIFFIYWDLLTLIYYDKDPDHNLCFQRSCYASFLSGFTTRLLMKIMNRAH